MSAFVAVSQDNFEHNDIAMAMNQLSSNEMVYRVWTGNYFLAIKNNSNSTVVGDLIQFDWCIANHRVTCFLTPTLIFSEMLVFLENEYGHLKLISVEWFCATECMRICVQGVLCRRQCALRR